MCYFIRIKNFEFLGCDERHNIYNSILILYYNIAYFQYADRALPFKII